MRISFRFGWCNRYLCVRYWTTSCPIARTGSDRSARPVEMWPLCVKQSPTHSQNAMQGRRMRHWFSRTLGSSFLYGLVSVSRALTFLRASALSRYSNPSPITWNAICWIAHTLTDRGRREKSEKSIVISGSKMRSSSRSSCIRKRLPKTFYIIRRKIIKLEYSLCGKLSSHGI